MAYFLLMITLSFWNFSELKFYLDSTIIIIQKTWPITISVVSLNTFLNNVGRLEPFNTVAWILIEIKLLSLDPFRKMFKRQKNTI